MSYRAQHGFMEGNGDVGGSYIRLWYNVAASNVKPNRNAFNSDICLPNDITHSTSKCF